MHCSDRLTLSLFSFFLFMLFKLSHLLLCALSCVSVWKCTVIKGGVIFSELSFQILTNKRRLFSLNTVLLLTCIYCTPYHHHHHHHGLPQCQKTFLYCMIIRGSWWWAGQQCCLSTREFWVQIPGLQVLSGGSLHDLSSFLPQSKSMHNCATACSCECIKPNCD